MHLHLNEIIWSWLKTFHSKRSLMKELVWHELLICEMSWRYRMYFLSTWYKVVYPFIHLSTISRTYFVTLMFTACNVCSFFSDNVSLVVFIATVSKFFYVQLILLQVFSPLRMRFFLHQYWSGHWFLIGSWCYHAFKLYKHSRFWIEQ